MSTIYFWLRACVCPLLYVQWYATLSNKGK